MTTCGTCGAEPAEAQIYGYGTVTVRCECGEDVSVSVASIDKQRGATVIHDTVAPDSELDAASLREKADDVLSWARKKAEGRSEAPPPESVSPDSIKMIRCPHAVYIPPTVWCPDCGRHLVKNWASLLVRDDPEKAAQEFANSCVQESQTLDPDSDGQSNKRVSTQRNPKRWWQFWK